MWLSWLWHIQLSSISYFEGFLYLYRVSLKSVPQVEMSCFIKRQGNKTGMAGLTQWGLSSGLSVGPNRYTVWIDQFLLNLALGVFMWEPMDLYTKILAVKFDFKDKLMIYCSFHKNSYENRACKIFCNSSRALTLLEVL